MIAKVRACVELKILRRVRAESSRRPPRDGASTAASSPRNDFVTIHRVHPTHKLIPHQVNILEDALKDAQKKTMLEDYSVDPAALRR